eukprot:7735252-Ditylum_brightwellii.AAC.1
MHPKGTFHYYNQCHNQVIWYQSSGVTTSHLPADAVITPAKTFGSLLVCRANLQHIHAQVQAQTAPAMESPTTFGEYFDQQPLHIKRLL